MAQNDYDKGSRVVAKLDPAGFLCWLLELQHGALVFRRWLDTRRLPFPGEPDRICDTVAFVEAIRHGHLPWAIIIEFQIEPDALLFGRMLVYAGQVWLELKPSEERGDRFWMAAAVVNLTGRGDASRTMAWDEAGIRTELTLREVNLCELDAKTTLDAIEQNTTTATILAWIPLMKNGEDSAIIQQWLTLASAEPDARRRAEYGLLALVFAEAAGCHAVWKQALTGWNMIQSQTAREWIAVGETQGETKGKIASLIRVLRGRFGVIPVEVEQTIQNTIDLALLDQWLDAAASSMNLDDFRRTTGM